MNLKKYGAFVALALAALAILAPDLTAQISADTALISRGARPFDRAIDPDLYLIRPGEELDVVFINTKLPNLHFSVNAEGKIVDRSLGELDLSNLTLSQAREQLLVALRRLYNAEEIVISINKIYPVAIQVSGLVQQPGTYVGYTSQTVREIIDSAGGLLPGASSRRISFSGGPKVLTVDLDRALNRGEREQDPFLYAGQRVEVPPQGDLAWLSGESFGGQSVELLDGDNLELLVNLAGGRPEELSLEMARAENAPDRKFTAGSKVYPGDRIYVPSAGTLTDGPGQARIYGAVAKEGRYALGGNWSLDSLIAAAGGVTREANRGRVAVFRRIDRHGSGGLKRYPLSAVSTADIVLENLDSVYVPFAVDYVKLGGMVTRPGYYPYDEGKTVGDYIRIAGGFSQLADRERILVYDRASGLTRQVGENDMVLDGDEIIVAELEKRE